MISSVLDKTCFRRFSGRRYTWGWITCYWSLRKNGLTC